METKIIIENGFQNRSSKSEAYFLSCKVLQGELEKGQYLMRNGIKFAKILTIERHNLGFSKISYIIEIEDFGKFGTNIADLYGQEISCHGKGGI